MATSFPVGRANNEEEVWAWLEPQFHQHGRQLYRFALGVLGNREDAEDATQIVLLNAYRALIRGERPTWPRAWLFAIALNVCRRLRRQATARHALVASARELLSLEPGSDAPTGTEILQALSSLPPAQRKIFLLRELRGLSYAELSDRLGLSPAAAESLLVRARRGLREELASADESTVRRPSRRRQLLSIPGAGAALRLVRAPASVKLAALAGTAAVAPALVVGLHVDPKPSQTPGLQAAALIVPPIERTAPRLAKHLSSPPALTPRAARSHPLAARPAGARALSPAIAGPLTGPAATAGASPQAEAGAADEVSPNVSVAVDPSSPGRGRAPAQPPGPTPPPVPATDATTPEGVVQAAETTVVTAVDEITAAVPAPDVPADVVPAAVPDGVVPDPPPVVQHVLNVASSAASAASPSALPAVLP